MRKIKDFTSDQSPALCSRRADLRISQINLHD